MHFCLEMLLSKLTSQMSWLQRANGLLRCTHTHTRTLMNYALPTCPIISHYVKLQLVPTVLTMHQHGARARGRARAKRSTSKGRQPHVCFWATATRTTASSLVGTLPQCVSWALSAGTVPVAALQIWHSRGSCNVVDCSDGLHAWPIDNCSNTFGSVSACVCVCVSVGASHSTIIMAIGSQATPKSMQHMWPKRSRSRGCDVLRQSQLELEMKLELELKLVSEEKLENASSRGSSCCGCSCHRLSALSSFWNLIKVYTSKQMTVCSRCRDICVSLSVPVCVLVCTSACMCVCVCLLVYVCALVCHMAANWMQAASGKSSEHFIKEKLRHKNSCCCFCCCSRKLLLLLAE